MENKKLKIALIYVSKHGTVEKVACAIADKLKESFEVELISLRKNANPDISEFELIILGTSVYASQPIGKMKSFCQTNQTGLLQKKIALFVCGMEPNKDKLETEMINAYPATLREKALASQFLGGEFLFEKMNVFERLIIKKIAKTDISISKIDRDSIELFVKKIASTENTFAE